MGVNIAYLPGIFGSRIAQGPYPPFFGTVDVWPGLLEPALLGYLQLELAADGVSPGPHTNAGPLTAVGLVQFAYQPLGTLMRSRGWNVLDCPYDWRKSRLVTAPATLAAIQGAFGQQPFAFVAHSQGALEARAVWLAMNNAGMAGQVAGMVTMGGPHFGSWEVPRGFFGLPGLYQLIAKFAGIVGLLGLSQRIDYLDDIIGSWPGWYEMAPFRDYGPLQQSDPATAAALYQTSFYAGGSPYVTAARLSAAAAFQNTIRFAYPGGRTICIVGQAYPTAFEVNAVSLLTSDKGYLFTLQGDGQVPASYAVLPQQVEQDITVFHGNMPTDPRVQRAVVWAVQQFFGPGA